MNRTRFLHAGLVVLCIAALLSGSGTGAVAAPRAEAPPGGPGRARTAPATDGDLDPAFGSAGQVITPQPGGADRAQAVLLQPDGAVLVAGAAGASFAFARYGPAGGLDPAFGTGGQVTVAFGVGTTGAAALARQADGKIVAAGGAGHDRSLNRTDFGLLRLTAAGQLDPAFGTGGRVTMHPGVQSGANAVVVQPDAKILAAGYADTSAVLARYLPDGSLDPTFGATGVVTPTFNAYNGDNVLALALQPDGRIVIGGLTHDNSGNAQGVLARYMPDGTLDATFGTAGEVIVATPGIRFQALLIAPGGKILTGGAAYIQNYGSDTNFILCRFNPDGSPDASFGSGGQVVTAFPTTSSIQGLAFANGSTILAAGSTGKGDSRAFALARYQPDGSLDPTFGRGGLVSTAWLHGGGANAVTILPGDRILAVGDADLGTPTGSDMALARYQANGTLDPSFGNGGLLTTAFAAGASEANALALQPDGKIVVAGQDQGAGGADFVVARYLGDGRPDPAFGAGGHVSSDFGGPEQANALAIQPDGKIVVAGGQDRVANNLYYQDFLLARYLPDGRLDTSFGSGGHVVTAFPAPPSFIGTSGGVVQALVLQPDGKILAGGAATTPCADAHNCRGAQIDGVLARYNPDGSLDAGFGQGGLVVTRLPAGSVASYFQINALALQPDGQILAAGGASPDPSYSDSPMAFELARYNPDGSLDAGFGQGGLQHTEFAPQPTEARALVRNPDGTIVLAGSADVTTTCYPVACVPKPDFALARYGADGHLDPTFGVSGTVTTTLSTHADAIRGLVRQADGKLVAAGIWEAGDHPEGVYLDSNYASAGFALVRYLPDGHVDPTFGPGGQVITAFGGAGAAAALALQPDGNLVAAGAGYDGAGGPHVALARYHDSLPPRCPGASFADGCPGDWFYPFAADLAAAGVLSGYLCGDPGEPCNTEQQAYFRPYNNITRSQLAKVTTLAFGIPLTQTAQMFADVPPGHPFYDYVNTLAAQGVISGYACGGPSEGCDPAQRPYFRPYTDITRAQAAKVVVLARGWPLLQPATPTFGDVPLGHPFYPYIETAAAQHVLGGYSDATFRPYNNITRAQAAKVVDLARGQPAKR